MNFKMNAEFFAYIDKHIKYSPAFFELLLKVTNCDVQALAESIFNIQLRIAKIKFFKKYIMILTNYLSK